MNPLAVDIETVDASGVSSFRWWKPGFSIQSLALSWRNGFDIESWFSMDPDTIEQAIRRLAATGRPLIVHNLAFEKGVFETLYPDLTFNWFADTMRLGQLHDNGGDWRDQVFIGDILDEEESPDLGLSLEAVASRVLQRDLHHHKDERDDYLRSLGVRSRFGGHIHLLPSDILERYNIADTRTTLEVYEALAPILDGVWQKDWPLYHNRTRLMNAAYRRGVKIDIESLERYVYEIDRDVDKIEAEFKSFHAENIKKWAEMTGNNEFDFNVGSNKQLKELFCDVLGMEAKHLTETGEKKLKEETFSLTPAHREYREAIERLHKQYPSFKSKHLSTWGPSGEILIKRRKRLLVLSQALSTLWMAKDGAGRCHPEQKVAGTRTNRVAGGMNE